MAKSVNKVFLLGNVGKDPEIRSTPSATMVPLGVERISGSLPTLPRRKTLLTLLAMFLLSSCLKAGAASVPNHRAVLEKTSSALAGNRAAAAVVQTES